MRTHGDYSVCQLWPFGADERELIAAGRLAVARFESIRRSSKMWGWLDLTFARDDATTLVSGILVDVIAASRNDPSALIFPRGAAAAIAVEREWELTSFLLPQLRMLTRARAVPSEEIMRFVPCEAFERARDAGEFGAAPLAAALVRMAPWVAAARLATGGPIAIHGRDWALGAAVARRFGVAVTRSSDVRADGWYRVIAGTVDDAPEVSVADTFAGGGTAPFCVALDAAEIASRDARVVGVPQPLPMEAVLTYDPDDAPEICRFAVAAPHRAFVVPERARTRPRTASRSLVMLVRDDFPAAPDADSDELGELALRARAAGIDVSFAAAGDLGALDTGAAVLACGAFDDPAFAQTLTALAGRTGPFAVVFTPAAPGAVRHEAALSPVVQAEDDELLESASRAFDARTLDSGVRAPLPPPGGVALTQLAAALSGAALLVPAVTDNRETFGLAELTFTVAGPIVPPDEGDDDAGSVCGHGPFIFAHAPATPRSGLLALALALRDTEIPCVIAAAVADLDYATELRRMAGPRTIVLSNASDGLINALYRQATIFVDSSIRPRGVSRIVRAARSGALPVVFAESPLAPLLPAESLVPRLAIVDLRDTLVRLWHSPLLAHHRSTARAMFATTLGDPGTVDASADVLLDQIERLCS
jgi:hypothetical protein